jgi:hypothetical protein
MRRAAGTASSGHERSEKTGHQKAGQRPGWSTLGLFIIISFQQLFKGEKKIIM